MYLWESELSYRSGVKGSYVPVMIQVCQPRSFGILKLVVQATTFFASPGESALLSQGDEHLGALSTLTGTLRQYVQ